MSECYQSVAERCEILAADLDDSGDKANAQLLWEADTRIRELEAENICLQKHLTDAANVFSTMGHRLRFFSLPGTQRREIANECRFRSEQFFTAAAQGIEARKGRGEDSVHESPSAEGGAP